MPVEDTVQEVTVITKHADSTTCEVFATMPDGSGIAPTLPGAGMKWTLKVGQLAGTVVYVHVTFFVLLAWIGVIDGMEKGSLAAAAEAVGFTMTLFACVVLHEFGHAFMARRFGIHTRDITLFPIGGVGRL